jgi:KEOPS complex subunit Cgi121
MKVQAYRCEKPVDIEKLMGFEEIQAIDSTLLYGLGHVESAFYLANRAMERGENISSNVFVETIVWASGQRQIKKAMAMFGLNSSKEIVIYGKDIPEEVESHLDAVVTEIKIDGKKLYALKKAYSISDTELNAVSSTPYEAVKDLIRERIALLSTL